MIGSAVATVLDTRSLPKPRCDAALAAFDRLDPGQTLAVVTDHDPTPLLRHLQRDRHGLFEWTPIERGPECWRTEVFRRAANLGDGRGVGEALAWDHDRLDATAERAFAERRAGRFDEAGRLWAVFEGGLRRHIGFEEAILFPAFEEGAGLTPEQGPTAVMRAEHREIEALLERVSGAVAVPGTAAETALAQLRAVLGGHNEKEELVLYPGTDRMLSPDEADALVARIQAS